MFDPKAAYRGTQAEYRRQGLVGAQVSVCEDGGVSHVVVVGGGPGGYEAALVAAQLGADVTVVDTDGIGGSAVLTDCVPSKTLIATAELMTDVEGANELGVMIGEDGVRVDLARVNARVKALAEGARKAGLEF